MKEKIYQILSVPKKQYSLSWYFDVFIIALILLNVLAILLESVEPFRVRHEWAFYYFEFFSVIIFTIEYVLRIWTANINPKFKRPFLGNIRFAFTPLLLIDLLAILPFYLPFFGADLRMFRILRIFRIFRVFKIMRYASALSIIVTVVKKKKEELIITLVFTLFLLLISSTLMYYVEHEAQPENFSSIPSTMWWGIATLTTVGYGDIYPITAWGKLLSSIIVLIGIGLFALPTGIIAAGFSEELANNKLRKNTCPTCGQSIKTTVNEV